MLIASDNMGRLFPMMMTAAGTIPPAKVLVLGAGVAGLQALATARRLGAKTTGYDVRPTSLESVIAVARRIAIDHVVAHYQGHAIRRTVANYPVLEVVELDTGPTLPAQQTLRRSAARRCGTRTAQASWAVIFTDTESPICCRKDVRFVLHLRNGWWVF